jgi:hypothetical protein
MRRRTFTLLDFGHGRDVVLDVLEGLLLRGQSMQSSHRGDVTYTARGAVDDILALDGAVVA